MSQKPSIGRIVQLRLSEHEYAPAVVLRVNGEGDGTTCNLHVFRDGDFNHPEALLVEAGVDPESGWCGSASEGEYVGQWRWPPRV